MVHSPPQLEKIAIQASISSALWKSSLKLHHATDRCLVDLDILASA
jgi:hypothetical protein